MAKNIAIFFFFSKIGFAPENLVDGNQLTNYTKKYILAHVGKIKIGENNE